MATLAARLRKGLRTGIPRPVFDAIQVEVPSPYGPPSHERR
jgi:hypothetical protein